jgi:assimilatory nitrate reductase electron transfer subunit
MSAERRVVVVGNGMAGCRFVQEVLELDLDRRLAITVVGDEPGGAYNRMLLSNVLAGATAADNILLASEQWYEAQGVALRIDTAVLRIDRAAQVVHLDDGDAVPYDVLVLATGSSPVLPPVNGLSSADGELLSGAVAFRTLRDCLTIDELAGRADSAVVLGAGVLGLEAARGLAGRGVAVNLVQRGARLMERQLDEGASRVLSRTARSLGVQLRQGLGVRAVQGENRVSGIVLEDGTVLDTDLLVLCCGVRPRVELARDAGLDVATGVVVDDQLRSVTDPAVFAIGECAEHRGRTYGLVAPVWDQARVAAQVIAQRTQPGEAASYAGSLTVTRLKAAGIELASLGDTAVGAGPDTGVAEDDGADNEDDADVICFVDRARGVYQKLIVREGRLAGAILLGDTRTIGTLTQLFDRGALLPSDRASLLIARRNAPAATAQSPTAIPGRATICQCNGVTKARICAAWQDGAHSVDEIAACTRATTGCGTCRDTVEGIIDWLAAADTDSRESQAQSDVLHPPQHEAFPVTVTA